MKNLLISTSIAVLMASNSMVSLASSLAVPNDFTSGTTAVAQEVNDNFTAVENSVNDNNSRIDTNAQDIADLQGAATTCPNDMVAVGSLCVDKYEASLWTAASGGIQISPAGSAPYYDPCNANGSNCDGIFAQSRANVTPAARVTWLQAVQACANVGKRLPTTAEWIMAADGTPEGTGDGITGCNSAAANSGTVATGTAAGCTSTAGAADMVGNLWEWVAEITPNLAGGYAAADTAGDFVGMAFGEAYDNDSGRTPDPRLALFLDGNFDGFADSGLLSTNSRNGFRCVR